ncbi:MAG: methionine--tRNA ligase [Clostridium sp.]|nr:methionine--tRNA ligase [Clostridium sp.]
MNSIYITTPIYYASGNPHLGHAYTTILADCFNRFFKLVNYETRLTTGTDEHGLKIERAAKKNEKEPKEFVDELARKFINSWKELNIEYDDFIRTTEERHMNIAQDMWRRMEANGDIYLGKYEGLYCIDCEQYYPESELLEGMLCPIHNKKVETMSEETYFFRLSKYHDRLLKYIEENPGFIYPEVRRNEVLGFLHHNRLQDLSISRTSFSWGIPVPGNDKHVMYVWIDALTNYISSLGGIGTELFNKYWSNTVHLIGKDILRFHAIYWPCMLMSAGVALPKSIIVHGWWTISNKKISKSDPATKIDPVMLSKDITVDGLRYFLLKELTLGKDGDLDYENLISSINIGLANNLGNLVNRTIMMVQKYLNGCVPALDEDSTNEFDIEIKENAFTTADAVKKFMEEYNPSGAVNTIMNYCNLLNSYLDKTLPWQLAKQPDQVSRLEQIFSYLLEALRWVSNIGYPFFPEFARGIKEQLGIDEAFSWPVSFCLSERKVSKGAVLFKRIGKDEEKILIEKWTK